MVLLDEGVAGGGVDQVALSLGYMADRMAHEVDTVVVEKTLVL